MLGNQLDETNLTVPHIMGLANKSFFLPRVVLSEPTIILRVSVLVAWRSLSVRGASRAARQICQASAEQQRPRELGNCFYSEIIVSFNTLNFTDFFLNFNPFLTR